MLFSSVRGRRRVWPEASGPSAGAASGAASTVGAGQQRRRDGASQQRACTVPRCDHSLYIIIPKKGKIVTLCIQR
jgi:hypothetical protein